MHVTCMFTKHGCLHACKHACKTCMSDFKGKRILSVKINFEASFKASKKSTGDSFMVISILLSNNKCYHFIFSKNSRFEKRVSQRIT
jgi:hypothetical protein